MKKRTRNPHDKLIRASMQNSRVAKAFFQRYVPPTVLAALNVDGIKLENSSYIDEKLQETTSDLVFTAPYIDTQGAIPANIIILVEHQSKPQRLLPFRVYHYLFNMLHKTLQAKGKAKDKLPPVYAFVFYNGKQTPYPYSMNLSDCFTDPNDLPSGVFRVEVPLIDVNQEQDDEQKVMGSDSRVIVTSGLFISHQSSK